MTPSPHSRHFFFLLLLLLHHHHHPSTALPSPNSSIATGNNEHSNEGFVLPIYHRSHPKVAHYFSSTTATLYAATNLTTTAAVATTNGDGSRINLKDAEYVVEFSIGTPPVNTYSVFDTGSDLLWLQSTLCKKGCYKQGTALYDPRRSKSFSQIPCNDWVCRSETGRLFCCPNGVCGFRIAYADSTSSTGVVAKETLVVTENGPLHRGIVFGAATGDSLPSWAAGHGPPGIAGFASKGFSLVPQLGIKSFSHCFPQDTKLLSYARFNQKAALGGTGTEALWNSVGLYYVSFTGIFLDFPLLFRPRMAATDMLVDTGTALTRLKPSVFDLLSGAIEVEMMQPPYRHDPVYHVNPSLSFCYKHEAADDLKKLVITLVLKDALLEVPFENAWITIIRSHFFGLIRKRYLCLAMLRLGAENLDNILGAYQMKNVNIGYDLLSEKVHFSTKDSSKLGG